MSLLACRSSASLPLLRSGRGLGLCRLLPLPGAGLAAPSLCGVCSAAPPLGGVLLLCLCVRRRGSQVTQGRVTLNLVPRFYKSNTHVESSISTITLSESLRASLGPSPLSLMWLSFLRFYVCW